MNKELVAAEKQTTYVCASAAAGNGQCQGSSARPRWKKVSKSSRLSRRPSTAVSLSAAVLTPVWRGSWALCIMSFVVLVWADGCSTKGIAGWRLCDPLPATYMAFRCIFGCQGNRKKKRRDSATAKSSRESQPQQTMTRAVPVGKLAKGQAALWGRPVFSCHICWSKRTPGPTFPNRKKQLAYWKRCALYATSLHQFFVKRRLCRVCLVIVEGKRYKTVLTCFSMFFHQDDLQCPHTRENLVSPHVCVRLGSIILSCQIAILRPSWNAVERLRISWLNCKTCGRNNVIDSACRRRVWPHRSLLLFGLLLLLCLGTRRKESGFIWEISHDLSFHYWLRNSKTGLPELQKLLPRRLLSKLRLWEGPSSVKTKHAIKKVSVSCPLWWQM